MALTGQFLEGIRQMPEILLYGPSGADARTAVVSFNIRGLSPSDVAFDLDEQCAILSRPGLHCAPAAHRPFRHPAPGHGAIQFRVLQYGG